VGSAVLRAFGANPAHVRVLVALFRTLGERQELTGQLGMDARAMKLVSYGLWVPGVLLALLALGPMSLRAYDLTLLSGGSFLLFMLVLLEASNTFLNPVEASVLASQPVTGPTYFVAKLSYLVFVVSRIVLPLQGPGALAGLLKAGARWFYPVTHLGAAWLLGVLIALGACAVFGVLFRWLPAARVRAAALWMQLALTTLPFFLNVGLTYGRRLARAAGPGVSAVDWSFVPIVWFNALSLVGHAGRPVVSAGPALVSGFVVAGFVAYGVRSLSTRYMSRITTVMRSEHRRTRRGGRRSPLGWLVGRVTRGPGGRAAFEFTTRQMRRDWQFRHAMMQALMLVVVVPALVISGRAATPFHATQPRLIGALPELLPLFTLMVCTVLSYSDQHRGAWVFLTVPRPALRVYAAGVLWTLWALFIVLPLAAALPLFTWYWGVRDAALFVAYSISAGSWLLTLQFALVEGLPFGSPPRSERTAAVLPGLIFGPVVIGIGFLLQWKFIFQSRWLTLGAMVVLAGLAVATARLTLALVNGRIDDDLVRLAGRPRDMFMMQ
jgi:hypothetical protein